MDGEVELDAEHVGLDGGAEAEGGVEVDEAVEQRAAPVVQRRHPDLGLDQVQHVRAHVQLQRVRRALAVPPARPTAASSSISAAAAAPAPSACTTSTAANDPARSAAYDPARAAANDTTAGTAPTAAAAASAVFTHIFPTWPHLMCIIVVYSVCYWPS